MENNLKSETIEKTPEQLEAEMFETRESLTEKVAALENQVVGTVKNAADTVTETVDAVKEFMHTAPEAVHDTVEQVTNAVTETVEQVTSAFKETVKKAFDVRAWVESSPWGCVGASVGIGFAAAYLIPRPRDSSTRRRLRPRSAESPTASMSPHPLSSAPEPSLFGSLFANLNRKFREKVKELSENAIDAASTALNRTVREQLPKLVEEAANRFVSSRGTSPGASEQARVNQPVHNGVR